MENLDYAHARLESLLPRLMATLTGTATEAEVRLQVIDRVLTEVMLWDHEEIAAEKRSGDGFADYMLRIGGKSRVVIEAKRDGRALGVRDKAPGSSFRLNGPVFSQEAAKEGIKQAVSYSGLHNAELSCVTNGLEWVIFRGNRLGDGTETLQGKAFVFPGLTEISERFELFYSLLSRESVKTFSYRPYFQEVEGQPIRTSVFSRKLAGTHVRLKPLTDLGRDLDRTMSAFFQRLAGEDEEMVRSCFVESPESRLADDRLTKVAEELVTQIRPLETGEGTALREVIDRNRDSVRKDFVLLVGTKGSGKSTFIDRFFKHSLPRRVAEHCAVIRVDLKGNPGDAKSVVTWLNAQVLDAAERALFPDDPTFDEIKGMFYDEYRRLSRGPLKPLYEAEYETFRLQFGERMDEKRRHDPHSYIQGLLRHARQHRESLPIVVLDNADHFDIEFQQAVYQYARSLYEQTPCLVIMPITDRTSWQLSKHGALQSFEVTTLFLPTPQIGDVIRKRILYIEEKIVEERRNPQSGYFVSRGISLSLEDLSGFARAMQRVFVETPNVSRTIGELANFDVRRTLDLTRRAITSPHLKVEDLIVSFVGDSAVAVPSWRIDRAIIRLGYETYPAGQHDFVQNIFDLDASLTTSPLLGLRLLTLLRNLPDKEHEGATIDVDGLRAYMVGMGITGRTVDLWLDVMLKTGLVLNYDPTVQDVEYATMLELSDAGKRHLFWGTGGIEYLSAVTETSPVLTESIYEQLRGYSHKDWRKRTADFIDYLVDEDLFYCTIPDHPTYESQERLHAQLHDAQQRLRRS